MKSFADLMPGQYYIPVFRRLDVPDGDFFEMYHTDAPFCQYLGGKDFADEDGDPVQRFYDPEIGLYVDVDAPDGFIQC